MGLIRTTVLLDKEAWEALGTLARLRGVAEDARISKGELVRRGVIREINENTRHAYPEQYEKP